MTKYIELIDKYEIRQSDSDECYPLSYIWRHNTGELIRCKDCKHRPKDNGTGNAGFSYDFPDYRCPCRCEDDFYSWIPDDDWYCANAERKKDG